MFSGPSLVSVATSLERERAAQPVRVATRASSIPIMSLRPNPHKSWAGSDLVTCSPSIGWELVSPFVADSRQYVAKYQQDRDRLGLHTRSLRQEWLHQNDGAVFQGGL
jgi:hypothetical protein